MGVLLTFTITTVAWGAPTFGTEVKGLSREIKIDPLADRITVPSELGSITETYVPAFNSELRAQSSSLIVHLEDAHGSVEAQLHQEEILRHLQKQYGLNTIFVEGGLGDLKPELLRFFKDNGQNQKLIDKLTETGLVGGVERFLSRDSGRRMEDSVKTDTPSPILHPPSETKAYGVEEAALYHRELELFREVYAGKTSSDQSLEEIRQKLLAQSAASFNPELRTFFREWLFQAEVQQDILSHLSFLQKYAEATLRLDLVNAREQYDWPQLVRFFKLKKLEEAESSAQRATESEKAKLLSWLNAQKLDSAFSESFEDFFKESRSQLSVARRTGEARTFLEDFYSKAAPLGFRFEDYPVLSKRMGRMILSQEIQTEALLTEMEKLNAKILEALAKTPEERTGVAEYQHYLLLKKLFALELTRREYHQMLAQRGKLKGETVDVERRALSFYEVAEQREDAIFKNMLSKMKEIKQPNAVLITGGFHSEGLLEAMKGGGLSYVRIAPRISGKVDDSNYLRVMAGGRAPFSKKKEPVPLSNSKRLSPSAVSNVHTPTFANPPDIVEKASPDIAGLYRQGLRQAIQDIGVGPDLPNAWFSPHQNRHEMNLEDQWIGTVEWPQDPWENRAEALNAGGLSPEQVYSEIHKKIDHLEKLSEVVGSLDDQLSVWVEGSTLPRSWTNWFEHGLRTPFQSFQGAWELVGVYNVSPHDVIEMIRESVSQIEIILAEYQALSVAVQDDFKKHPKYLNADYSGKGTSPENRMTKTEQMIFFPHEVFIKSQNRERNRAVFCEAVRRMEASFSELQQFSEKEIARLETQEPLARSESRAGEKGRETLSRSEYASLKNQLGRLYIPQKLSPYFQRLMVALAGKDRSAFLRTLANFGMMTSRFGIASLSEATAEALGSIYERVSVGTFHSELKAPAGRRLAGDVKPRSESRELPEGLREVSKRELDRDRAAVVFTDVHGVILKPVWELQFAEAYRRIKKQDMIDEGHQWVRDHLEKDLTAELARISGGTPESVRELLAQIADDMEAVRYPEPVPEFVEFLLECKEMGIPIVITSGSRLGAARVVEQLQTAGLQWLLDYGVFLGREEMKDYVLDENYKKDTRDRAIREIRQDYFPGMSPLYFTDSADGIAGTQDVGGYAFGVASSGDVRGQSAALATAGADLVIEAPRAFGTLSDFLALPRESQKHSAHGFFHLRTFIPGLKESAARIREEIKKQKAMAEKYKKPSFVGTLTDVRAVRHSTQAADEFDPYFGWSLAQGESEYLRHARVHSYLLGDGPETMKQFFSSRIRRGARVLDLLAGSQTHLDPGYAKVTGVGLNAYELYSNPNLSDFLTQDLNANPELPSALDGTFDAVIMSSGMAYLKDPAAVFKAAARVLKPGGVLLIIYNDQYNQEVIPAWKDLKGSAARLTYTREALERSGGFLAITYENSPGQMTGVVARKKDEPSREQDAAIAIGTPQDTKLKIQPTSLSFIPSSYTSVPQGELPFEVIHKRESSERGAFFFRNDQVLAGAVFYFLDRQNKAMRLEQFSSGRRLYDLEFKDMSLHLLRKAVEISLKDPVARGAVSVRLTGENGDGVMPEFEKISPEILNRQKVSDSITEWRVTHASAEKFLKAVDKALQSSATRSEMRPPIQPARLESVKTGLEIEEEKSESVTPRAESLPPREAVKDFLILAPVFNEEDDLPSMIAAARKGGYLSRVLYVDDGSRDGTRRILEKKGAFFISFERNRQKEGSIALALDHLEKDLGWSLPPYLVTFDGGDSVLVSNVTGQTVLDALSEAVQSLREGDPAYVAQPIMIQARTSKALGLLERVQQLMWQMNMALSGKKPYLPGGGEIYQTKAYREALRSWPGSFASGSKLLELRLKQTGVLAPLLRTLSVRTAIMSDWESYFAQQRRFAEALFTVYPWMMNLCGIAISGFGLALPEIVILGLGAFLVQAFWSRPFDIFCLIGIQFLSILRVFWGRVLGRVHLVRGRSETREESRPKIVMPEEFRGTPYAKWAPWLRVFDIAISLLILFPAMTVAMIVFGPLIKLESPGPIFFKQKRPGYKGRNFDVHKFRTMRVTGSRVPTRLGAFLRQTAIDELPQVINILKGEMSFFGPRPLPEGEMKVYAEEDPELDYSTILDTRKPGYCSLFMIRRGFGKGMLLEDEFREAMRLNAYEVRHWSLALMARIIVGTSGSILKSVGRSLIELVRRVHKRLVPKDTKSEWERLNRIVTAYESLGVRDIVHDLRRTFWIVKFAARPDITVPMTWPLEKVEKILTEELKSSPVSERTLGWESVLEAVVALKEAKAEGLSDVGMEPDGSWFVSFESGETYRFVTPLRLVESLVRYLIAFNKERIQMMAKTMAEDVARFRDLERTVESLANRKFVAYVEKDINRRGMFTVVVWDGESQSSMKGIPAIPYDVTAADLNRRIDEVLATMPRFMGVDEAAIRSGTHLLPASFHDPKNFYQTRSEMRQDILSPARIRVRTKEVRAEMRLGTPTADIFDDHKDAYLQIHQAVKEGLIPEDLALVLFDYHSDNASGFGAGKGVEWLGCGNWIAQLLADKDVNDIFWAYPTDGRQLLGKSSDFKEMHSDWRRLLLQNLPRLKKGVVLSLDMDYFARVSRGSEVEYLPEAGEIQRRVLEIFAFFKENGIPVYLVNGAYSAPVYAPLSYKKEFQDAISEAVQTLPILRSETRSSEFRLGKEFDLMQMDRMISELLTRGSVSFAGNDGDLFTLHYQYQDHAYRDQGLNLIERPGVRVRLVLSRGEDVSSSMIGFADLKIADREGKKTAWMDTGFETEREDERLVDKDTVALWVDPLQQKAFFGTGFTLMQWACAVAKALGAQTLYCEQLLKNLDVFHRLNGARLENYSYTNETPLADDDPAEATAFTGTRAVYDLSMSPRPDRFKIARMTIPEGRSEIRKIDQAMTAMGEVLLEVNKRKWASLAGMAGGAFDFFQKFFHVRPRVVLREAIRHGEMLRWLAEELPREVDLALIRSAILLHIDKHADISQLHPEPTSGNVVRQILEGKLVRAAWWAASDPQGWMKDATYSNSKLFGQILRFSEDFPPTDAPVILSIDLDAFASSVEPDDPAEMRARVDRVLEQIRKNHYRILGVFIASSIGVFNEEPQEPGYTRKKDVPFLLERIQRSLRKDYKLASARSQRKAESRSEVREETVRDFLRSIEEDFFALSRKHGLLPKNNGASVRDVRCMLASEILAKSLERHFGLARGGKDLYRTEVVEGRYLRDNTRHYWLAIHLGSEAPSLLVDGSYGQFNALFEGKILAEAYEKGLEFLKLKDERHIKDITGVYINPEHRLRAQRVSEALDRLSVKERVSKGRSETRSSAPDPFAAWTAHFSGGRKTSVHPSQQEPYESFWQNIFERLPSGARVLDLGAGNLFVTQQAIEVQKRSGKKFELYALDGADIAADQIPEEVHFVKARGEDLALTNIPAGLDLAVSQYGLEYMNKEGVMEALSQKLKPGGQVVLIMHARDSGIVSKALYDLEQFERVAESGIFGAVSRSLEASLPKPVALREGVVSEISEGFKVLSELFERRKNALSFTFGFGAGIGGIDVLEKVKDGAGRFLAAYHEGTKNEESFADLSMLVQETNRAEWLLQERVSAAMGPSQMEAFINQARRYGFEPLWTPEVPRGRGIAGWQVFLGLNASSNRSEARFVTDNYEAIKSLAMPTGTIPALVSRKHDEIFNWLKDLQARGVVTKETTIINFDTHPDNSDLSLNIGSWMEWIRKEGISLGRRIWVRAWGRHLPPTWKLTGLSPDELQRTFGGSENIYESVRDLLGRRESVKGRAVVSLDLDFLAIHFERAITLSELDERIDDFIKALFASGIEPVAFHISISREFLAGIREHLSSPAYLNPPVETVILRKLEDAFGKAGAKFGVEESSGAGRSEMRDRIPTEEIDIEKLKQTIRDFRLLTCKANSTMLIYALRAMGEQAQLMGMFRLTEDDPFQYVVETETWGEVDVSTYDWEDVEGGFRYDPASINDYEDTLRELETQGHLAKMDKALNEGVFLRRSESRESDLYAGVRLDVPRAAVVAEGRLGKVVDARDLVLDPDQKGSLAAAIAQLELEAVGSPFFGIPAQWRERLEKKNHVLLLLDPQGSLKGVVWAWTPQEGTFSKWHRLVVKEDGIKGKAHFLADAYLSQIFRKGKGRVLGDVYGAGDTGIAEFLERYLERGRNEGFVLEGIVFGRELSLSLKADPLDPARLKKSYWYESDDLDLGVKTSIASSERAANVFGVAEQRVAMDVAEQTLRSEKVGLLSPEVWRGFWTSLVPNAYADQVTDLGMQSLTNDVLEKAKDAPFKVSVTLAGKPSLNDPVIRLLSETLVKKPGIAVQIVALGLSRSESSRFQQELTKQVMILRKDQRSSSKGVKLFVTPEPGAVTEFTSGGQVRTLVYDMRENVQAELESLALKIARGETLIVSDTVELNKKAYALLAALDKLFDPQQLPRTVQSAAQLLSENLRIAAEAARSILQAA